MLKENINNSKSNAEKSRDSGKATSRTSLSPGRKTITPLGRARLSLAISAGKLAGASGRLLRVGGGTSLPGMIARRIDPDILKSVIGRSKAKKIVITGSNGKTTTSRMAAAIATHDGERISPNRTGSEFLPRATSGVVNLTPI